MSEFHFKLGQADAKAGRHVEPPGCNDLDLSDWRKGHGPGSIQRPQTTNNPPPVAARTVAARDPRPYTPFSTSLTKRKSTSGARTPEVATPAEPRKSSPAASIVAPSRPVMGLFGPIEVAASEKPPAIKAPAPIPDVDRDGELEILQSIGIGQSGAVELIASNWTLDQLICQALAQPAEDCESETVRLPTVVMSALPIVKAYCSAKWPQKGIKDETSRTRNRANMASRDRGRAHGVTVPACS